MTCQHMMALIKKHTPLVNPRVANGIAVEHVKYAGEYINSVMVSAAQSFPEGLEYVGCEQCTPQEEFNEVTRPRNNKRDIDIARSDLYLMKYYFRFKGVDMPPRYLYLPAVGEAGSIFLGGSRFIVSPVLTDRVISPGYNNVFVRLLRDKVTFERLFHTMQINGARTTTQIIFSAIYRKTTEIKKMVRTTKAETTLTHYLIAKFGFTEAFKKFCHCVPVLGTTETITAELYPADKWVICSSIKIKPKTFIGDHYKPSNLAMAVPIENFSSVTKSMVSEFFYIVDHFPTRIVLEHVDNKTIWMVLLGHIIFSGVYGEGKLHGNILEHFNSLDEYMDNLVLSQLFDLGYKCSSFYDLLAIVLEHFNEWVINGSEQTNSLYGKELSVLYHMLFGITSAIFRTGFRLNKIASKKALTIKEITEVMNKNLRSGLIYSITRNHVNMSTIAYSGDNKFFKITSMMVPQDNASNRLTRVKKSKSVTDDPSKKVHVSIAEVGSHLYIPKSSPRGDSRISPFVTISAAGTVVQNIENKVLLDKVAAMIKD